MGYKVKSFTIPTSLYETKWGFDHRFQPLGLQFDYALDQIPTLPVLERVGLNIDRCIT